MFVYTVSRCPFQNPFWFIDRPTADHVYDENGDMVPNKIRVIWGRMQNFQCVDYFQIEYFSSLDVNKDSVQKLDITERIDRKKRYFDIDAIPCTEYYFKIIAAEDWSGIRDDFKVYSEATRFTVRYTPRFKLNPRFKEKRRIVFKPPPPTATPILETTDSSLESNATNEDLYEEIIPQEPELVPTEEVFYNIRWKLRDIDYPYECLNHFEIHYLDLLDFNSTKFLRSVSKPQKKRKFLVQIQSEEFGAKCGEFDVQFIFRMFGIHRKFTELFWTPPPCVLTTTTLAPPTTEYVPFNLTADFNGTDFNFDYENFNSSYYNFSSSSDYEISDVGQNWNESVKELIPISPSMDPTEIIATTRSYAEEMRVTRVQISSLKEDYERKGWDDFTTLKDSFFESMKEFLKQMKNAEDADEEERMLFEDGE